MAPSLSDPGHVAVSRPPQAMGEAWVATSSRSLKHVRSGTNCVETRRPQSRSNKIVVKAARLVMAYLCRQVFHCLGNRADLLCCRGPGDGFLSSATLFAQCACTSRSLPTITKSEFSNLIISSSFCQIQVELSNLRLLPPRPSLDPPRRRQHSAGCRQIGADITRDRLSARS